MPCFNDVQLILQMRWFARHAQGFHQNQRIGCHEFIDGFLHLLDGLLCFLPGLLQPRMFISSFPG